jgi:putative heme-binding domain-containing protein
VSRALLLLFCFRRASITIWWRTFFCAGILIVAGKLWADTTTEEHKARQRAADISNVEALVRLPNFDLGSRPDLQASVDRYLEAHHGTTRYFQLIRQFQLRERSAELLALALSQPKTTPGLWATETLIGFGQRREIEEAVHHKDARRATAAVIALGSVGDPSALDFLARVILKGDLATEVRAAAAAALARSRGGEELLLQAIHEKTLPVDLNFSVGNLLHVSPNPASRALAAARFPLPTVADGNSLPPLQELVAQAGNVRRGSTVFRTKGTCAACHKVAGEGKEVGPDLTEIGSKLSKEAIYVSILDPNAGISHNYENYEIITQSGQIETGLLLDRSGNNIEIKNAEGLVRSFRDSDIESIRKLEVSLMPVGLQQKLTEEELVDLVEYLARLKTKQ